MRSAASARIARDLLHALHKQNKEDIIGDNRFEFYPN